MCTALCLSLRERNRKSVAIQFDERCAHDEQKFVAFYYHRAREERKPCTSFGVYCCVCLSISSIQVYTRTNLIVLYHHLHPHHHHRRRCCCASDAARQNERGRRTREKRKEEEEKGERRERAREREKKRRLLSHCPLFEIILRVYVEEKTKQKESKRRSRTRMATATASMHNASGNFMFHARPTVFEQPITYHLPSSSTTSKAAPPPEKDDLSPYYISERSSLDLLLSTTSAFVRPAHSSLSFSSPRISYHRP